MGQQRDRCQLYFMGKKLTDGPEQHDFNDKAKGLLFWLLLEDHNIVRENVQKQKDHQKIPDAKYLQLRTAWNDRSGEFVEG